jgi:hypothetical protein
LASNLRKKPVKCYIWSILSCSWNLDTLKSRSEIRGKFWTVMLDKHGEDQLDQLCEKWVSITYSKWGKEYPTYNNKEGWLEWSHLEQKISSKTHYWSKDRREARSGGKMRKKM